MLKKKIGVDISNQYDNNQSKCPDLKKSDRKKTSIYLKPRLLNS